MNPEFKQKNIKEVILGKIQSGEIQMTSKSYFMLRLCLMASVIFLIFIASTFLLSYILFSINAGGYVYLLGFGMKGFYHFLVALPWLLLLIITGLLILLDRLLKSFEFGYKSPILYLFMATLTIITVFGLLVNSTSFHGSMMRRAEEKYPELAPGFNGLYGDIRKSHKKTGVFRGTVYSISTSSFQITYESNDIESGQVKRVYVPEGVNIGSIIGVGDSVFIAGKASGEEIMAYGLHKLVEQN